MRKSILIFAINNLKEFFMNQLLKASLLSAIGLSLLGTIPSIKKGAKELEDAVINVNPNVKRYTDFNGSNPKEPSTNKSLSYNVAEDFLFKRNKTYTFKFTAPSTAYFVFDALSDSATQLCVEKTNGTQIFDVGGEAASGNARIRIKLSKNQTVKVYSRLREVRDNEISDTVTMIVRKPKISLTSTYLLDPLHFSKADNVRNTEKWYKDSLIRIDDHYLIDVHGGVSSEEVYDHNFYASDVVAYWGFAQNMSDGSTKLYVDEGYIDFPTQQFNFYGTTLALWCARGTAIDNSYRSVMANSYIYGAKCSVGIIMDETISDDMARNFMCSVLNRLSEPGKTVGEAVAETQEAWVPYYETGCDTSILDVFKIGEGFQLPHITKPLIDNSASYDIDAWNRVKPVRITGDEDTVLVGDTISNGNFPLTNSLQPEIPSIVSQK